MSLLKTVLMLAITCTVGACASNQTQLANTDSNSAMYVANVHSKIISSSQADLWWDPVPGAKSYEVFFKTMLLEETSKCKVSLNYLMPETDYEFLVKVVR